MAAPHRSDLRAELPLGIVCCVLLLMGALSACSRSGRVPVETGIAAGAPDLSTGEGQGRDPARSDGFAALEFEPGAAPARGGTRDAPLEKEAIPPEAATGYRARPPVIARRFMAVAANPYAAEAGAQMLREGGSAVDAAVAMLAVLTLVEPQSSGLGGGGFLLHFDHTSKVLSTLDGRETAPRDATPDQFMRAGRPMSFPEVVPGGLSVGTPGIVRMLERAHRMQGKLPWSQLLAPAIRLSTEGFEVSERLHTLLDLDPALRLFQPARAYFYDAEGRPWPVGHVLKNPALAATLRLLAEQGPDAFYRGALAESLVRAVQGSTVNPGRLSLEDLAQYEPLERPPVCVRLDSRQICGMGPPSAGALAVGQILGILEPFDLDQISPDSVEAAHLFIEAHRLALADRAAYVADPLTIPVPVRGLLSAPYLLRRSALIRLERRMDSVSAGVPDPYGWRFASQVGEELPSTSHMVAVDLEGDVVSMTASIEGAFGSRLLVGGFLLNNQLTDFSFVPEEGGRPVANALRPGRRPRSSMSPTLVLDSLGQEVVLALGSPGGSRIPAYVARALLGVLEWKLDLQVAFNRPHIAARGDEVELESGPGWEFWTQVMRSGLEARGHRVVLTEMNSGLHGLVRTSEGWLGAVDPRREGKAIGE